MAEPVRMFYDAELTKPGRGPDGREFTHDLVGLLAPGETSRQKLWAVFIASKPWYRLRVTSITTTGDARFVGEIPSGRLEPNTKFAVEIEWVGRAMDPAEVEPLTATIQIPYRLIADARAYVEYEQSLGSITS